MDLTVVQECHEELGFPAVVLTDDEFTEDLKFMIKRFKENLKPVTKENKPVLGYEED